jgi:hypothetical protein
VAYLGHTPRTYFEDADASVPTDVRREAAGPTSWWARLHGGADDAQRSAKEAELVAYLAEDRDPEADDLDDEDDDVDGMDEADVFVEVKTARFPGALGLPMPGELPR